MDKHDVLLAHRNHLCPTVYHFFREPLLIERAKDQYVWDADGRHLTNSGTEANEMAILREEGVLCGKGGTLRQSAASYAAAEHVHHGS